MNKNCKISSKDVFYGNLQPSFPQLCGEKLYWLQAVLERSGAAGLYTVDLSVRGAKPELVSPPGMEPNSKVHEYGGRSYLVSGEYVFFANASDQQIYRLTIETGELLRLSDDIQFKYTEFLLATDGGYLVCVAERIVDGANNENMIVGVNLHVDNVGTPFTVLASGADFYAGLVIDVPRQKIAWFEWDHPHMPWDSSRLVIAQYSEQLTMGLRDTQVLIDLPDTSVCQTHFTPDGALVFAIDGQAPQLGDDNLSSTTNTSLESWQLMLWKDNRFERLSFDNAEYGAPFWVFGEYRLANFTGGLGAIRSSNGYDRIVGIEQAALPLVGTSINGSSQFDVVQQLLSDNGEYFCALAGSADQPLGIWSYSDDSAHGENLWQRITGPESVLPSDCVSRPKHFAYPTRDGMRAYAYYYPPSNCEDKPQRIPPLVVMIHGGPTSKTNALYDPLKQFWTTHGYAVLDVNHRGSSGYGREFRQSLLGRWGERDIEDVIDAIDYVISKNWANSEEIFVRGKSAGGYAVLRLLTEYGEYFAAGASYYGIGNLAVLAEDTHKFEFCYSEQLLGRVYDAKNASKAGDPYYDRSPVNFLDNMCCPVIVFQGSEDRVVPPSLAHNLVAVLKQKGIFHEYIEYPGEGHGFRNPKNSSDALQRELDFYSAALVT